MWLLVGAVSAALWLRWVQTSYQGINSDAADYAQIARHVARGHGLQTSVLRPMRLAILDDASGPHPDVTRQPLYSLILAALFRLFGTCDRTVLLASGLSYGLTGLATFWLGAHLFGSGAGLVATLFTLTNLELLDWAVSGYSETLLSWLWTLALLTLLYVADQPSMAVLAGGMLALCYLTRANMMLAVVPCSLHALWTGGLPTALALVLGFALLAVPWWWRNWRITGDPLFTDEKAILLFNIPAFPGETLWQRLEHPQLANLMWKHARALWQKARFHWIEYRHTLPRLTPLWLPALLGIAFQRLSWPLESWRLAFIATLIPQTPLFLLLHPFARYFVPFVPLVDILGVAAIAHLSTMLKLPLVFSCIVLLVMFVLSRRHTWQGLVDSRRKYRILSSNLDNVYAHQMRCLRGKGTIATDIPWAVSWHADCDALLLPIETDAIEALECNGLQLEGFYFSAFMRWWPEPMCNTWLSLAEQQPESFQIGGLTFVRTHVFERKEYCDNRIAPVFYRRKSVESKNG